MRNVSKKNPPKQNKHGDLGQVSQGVLRIYRNGVLSPIEPGQNPFLTCSAEHKIMGVDFLTDTAFQEHRAQIKFSIVT